MKTKNIKQKAKGFTLVELLVVIVIIATLAGISGAAYTGLQKSTLKKRNVTLHKQLDTSIQSFHLDYGAYPAVNTDDSSEVLFACLFEGADKDGVVPVAGAAGKITVYAPYLDPNKGSSVVDATSDKILDPYGNPYLYLDHASNQATAQNPDFDLWSTGKDGGEEGASDVDDVTNW